jgi:hypothetical protein
MPSRAKQPPVRNTRRTRTELRRLGAGELITVEEVSAILGVCTRTVMRHVKSGFIPPPERQSLGRITLNRWPVGVIRRLLEE